MAASELELLEKWRAGDREAGSELFARHFDAVYGFFRSKIEHAAEDLTQQTFLRCVEGKGEFRGGSGVRTYLLVIARNLLYSHLRRPANRAKDPDFEVDSLAELEPTASAVMLAREEHKLLVHALRRLPVELQIALELYYVQRLRGPQLAEVLGVPLGTARSRIRRGIEMLRQNIAELSQSAQPIRTTLTDLRRWAGELRGAG